MDVKKDNLVSLMKAVSVSKAKRQADDGVMPTDENILLEVFGEKKQLANHRKILTVDDSGKPRTEREPYTAAFIWAHLNALLPGIFKRLGNTPFCIVNDEIYNLGSAAKFFAMVQKLGVPLDWNETGDTLMKRSDFFSFVGQHADKYNFISDLPCYPEMPGILYTNKVLPRETGKLNELVRMFHYATDIDRQLIMSMFLTPFWGGDCGKRPAFLVDGLESDPKGNRGIGKSTLTDALVELCGGSCIDLTTKNEGEDIKKRILTAVSERIVRMDNVKSQSLSNETLESLITARKVSGHKLFHGQASVPNAFTYVLTFNDAALSKDMSQRCMIIKLKRPTFTATWWDDVVEFIRAYRQDIFADIGFYLTKTPGEFKATCRFPKWERDVLSVCADTLKEIQESIVRDQESVDDDNNLREDIHDIIAERISNLRWKYDSGNVYFDPEKHTVAINRAVIYRWVAHLFSQKSSTRYIAKKFNSARPSQILPDAKLHQGVYYMIWVGANKKDISFHPKSCWRVSGSSLNQIDEWPFQDFQV